MILNTTQLPKQAVVPNISGTENPKWANINEIVKDPVNNEVFDMSDLPQLAESIDKNGIVEYPVVWKGTTMLVSGHRRTEAGRLNKYTHYPVIEHTEERPKKDSEVLDRLRLYNEYRKITFGQRYRGLEKKIEAYTKETGMAVDNAKLTEFCKDWGVAIHDHNYMVEMKSKWPDFYRKALDDKMGVRDAHKVATYEPPKMADSKELKNIVSSEDQTLMVNSVYNSLRTIHECMGGELQNGVTFPTMRDVDRNWYSTAVHGVLCSWVANLLNSLPTFSNDWIATNNMNRLHDIYSELDKTGIEVKTTIQQKNEQPQWTPTEYKQGYHLLWWQSRNLETVFCGFGYLEEDTAKTATGGKWVIINDELLKLHQKGEFEIWRGELYEDIDGKPKFSMEPTRLKRFF
jgi:hypothetical protein